MMIVNVRMRMTNYIIGHQYTTKKNDYRMKQTYSQKSQIQHLKYHNFHSEHVMKYLTEGNLQIQNPKSYFPLLDYFLSPSKQIDQGHPNYQWFHRYKLLKIFPSVPQQTCAIWDNYLRKRVYNKIFFKTNSILVPIDVISGVYGTSHACYENTYLTTANTLHNKLYDPFNVAYVECLANLLVSSLTENNICPHFPLLYGIYNGIASKQTSDFTDNYTHCKDEKWFKHGLLHHKWDISIHHSSDTTSSTAASHSSDSSSNEEEASSSSNMSCTANDHPEYEMETTLSCSSNSKSQCESTESQSTELELEPTEQTAELEGDTEFIALLNQLTTVQVKETNVGINDLVSLHLKDVPVQILALEHCGENMEDIFISDFEHLLYANQHILESTTLEKTYFYTWLLKTRIHKFHTKWTAIFMQILMACISMQIQFNMIHNDLHSLNILLKPTKQSHFVYQFQQQYYCVPTYGWIVKIIDYGRATFNVNHTIFISDAFKSNEEAGDQYSYVHNQQDIKQLERKGCPIVLPNPSFDLCRLACCVNRIDFNSIDYCVMELWIVGNIHKYVALQDRSQIQYYMNHLNILAEVLDITSLVLLLPFENPFFQECFDSMSNVYQLSSACVLELFQSNVYNELQPLVTELIKLPFFAMLYNWNLDDYGIPMTRFDNFDLYQQIARDVHHVNPVTVLEQTELFHQFKCTYPETIGHKIYQCDKKILKKGNTKNRKGMLF